MIYTITLPDGRRIETDRETAIRLLREHVEANRPGRLVIRAVRVAGAA